MENKNAMDAALETSDELTRYQVEVLGDALFKLQDTDNPPSKAELKQMQDYVQDQSPDIIKSKLDGDVNANSFKQEMPQNIAEFTMN
jgi:hypothetical protein